MICHKNPTNQLLRLYRTKDLRQLLYLLISGRRRVGFIPYPRVFAQMVNNTDLVLKAWLDNHSSGKKTLNSNHLGLDKCILYSKLLWIPAYGQAKAGRPARTYIQQLCEDTGCDPEDLPKAMNDWEKWRERVRDIHAGGTT